MKIAAIRIRGLVGIKAPTKATLEMLRLYRKNYCVVFENNPSMMGMIQKSKDFITWGEISEATYQKLVEKRGQEYQGRTTDRKGLIKYKYMEVNGKKIKPFFALAPSRGGFGRKGIKKPFSEGGAVGYRGEKITALIEKML